MTARSAALTEEEITHWAAHRRFEGETTRRKVAPVAAPTALVRSRLAEADRAAPKGCARDGAGPEG